MRMAMPQYQPTTRIDVTGLPALQAVLWDRHGAELPAETVLHLYEDRWAYIEPAEMNAGETALLNRLVQELGNGVFLG